jgi:PKD repeat protein
MRTLLLLIAVFGFSLLYSQHLNCATDEMHFRLMQEKPEITDYIREKERILENFTQEFIAHKKQRSNDVYIIPVVFHIIHDYGQENITDEQIYDAIHQVNIQMRMKNADTSDIVQAFKAIAADAEIEIRLAQKDPNGNCTSGITRTVSSLTSPGDHGLKSLIQWPPDKYLNIYVAREAATLAGHAMMPAASDTVPEWDGIVMSHSYVGTIGTSDFFRRTVLTHEIGHYLNLQHIWGGNNVPNYPYLVVGQDTNCLYDDGVDDTPLTKGWSTCNTSSQSCGSLDNVQNYMDYAYCARMFTEGQRDRMHAALNSSVAGRNNLWQPENLDFTGVSGICNTTFYTDNRVVCSGNSVTFKVPFGENEMNELSWYFEGGTPTYSNLHNPTVQYNAPGKFKVKLMVTKGSQTAIVEKEAFITALPIVGSKAPISEGFESYATLAETFNWNVANQPSSTEWSINQQVGYNSNQSIWINNFNAPNATYSFTSKTIDAEDFIGETLTLGFDVAYARRNVSNNELLRVLTSTNCGTTWTQRAQYGAATLETGPISTSEFFPANNQWSFKQITIPQGDKVSNLLIKFEFVSGSGSNIFIDNINLQGDNSSILPRVNFTASKETICQEEMIQFIDMSSFDANTSWTWVFAGGTPEISNSQNPIVKYAQTGTYPVVLEVRNNQGNNSLTKTSYITVESAPQKPLIEKSGNTLTVSNPQGQSIQWYYEGFLIEGATQASYNYTAEGNYTVSLTISGGCKRFSDVFNTESSVSIKQTEFSNAIKIYPNPTRDNLVVEIDLIKAEKIEIVVFDILGKIVSQQTEKLVSSGIHNFTVTSSNFQQGIYLVQVKTGNTTKTLKFLKN